MKPLITRFFSFDGRLARLPFFTRTLQVAMATIIMFFASLPLFMNGGSLLWCAGILLVTMSVLILGASIISLTVRRLHDLGLSGYHAIWVLAIDVVGEVLSYGSSKAVLVSLLLVPIGLWLQFWPGNKQENRFGAVPD